MRVVITIIYLHLSVLEMSSNDNFIDFVVNRRPNRGLLFVNKWLSCEIFSLMWLAPGSLLVLRLEIIMYNRGHIC